MIADQPKQTPTYTIIPNKALEALVYNKHGGSDVLVYQSLCKHYNFDKNQCWPSINTLSKTTGISVKNIGRCLKSLCYSGMIVREKSRSEQGDFDRNVYFLPHFVLFQIENITNSKSPNKKILDELKELSMFLTGQIERFRGTINMKVRTFNKKEGAITMSTGTIKTDMGVPSQSPTNNTIINITNNITKNVSENNEDEIPASLKPFDLKKSKRYSSTPQSISDISSFSDIKRESLAQQMASELNDSKSLPFYRMVASAFSKYDDIIYKCLSLTREIQETTGIKKSRGAAFTDLIKREAEKLSISL